MAKSSSWREIDGAWRRSLGSMESFYLTLASPEGQPVHWMIGCCTSIAYHGDDGLDIQRALQQAWRKVRCDLPNVGATVDRATGEIVVGPSDEADLDTWLLKSFQTHDRAIADELFSDFKSQLCITLHYLPGSNQLLIQAPHVLIDGRGILYLYHALFTALSQQPGTHAKGNDSTVDPPKLAVSFDEWLQVPAIPSENNINHAQSIFQRILQQKNPIQLPGVDFSLQPRKAVHRDLKLSNETTKSIILACKEKGISVTSAWHAALAMRTQVSKTYFIRTTTYKAPM